MTEARRILSLLATLFWAGVFILLKLVGMLLRSLHLLIDMSLYLHMLLCVKVCLLGLATLAESKGLSLEKAPRK